jgi:hypothetical protein
MSENRWKIIKNEKRTEEEPQRWETLVERQKTDTTATMVNMEVAESLAPDNQKFRSHLDTIKERESLLETEMCKLTQEMLAVSLYIQKSTVTLENCKLTVKLLVREQLDVWLELKETGKDRYMTWKELLGDNWKQLLGRGPGEIFEEIRKGKNLVKVARFSFTKDWQLADRDFPSYFLRLLPAARILANEELEKLQAEAQGDIEYLKADSLNF